MTPSIRVFAVVAGIGPVAFALMSVGFATQTWALPKNTFTQTYYCTCFCQYKGSDNQWHWANSKVHLTSSDCSSAENATWTCDGNVDHKGQLAECTKDLNQSALQGSQAPLSKKLP